MRLDAILRAAELRAIEARAVGIPLMERAGLAAAEVARSMLAVHSARVLVLAGPGNNGGDAIFVSRLLHIWLFFVHLSDCGGAAAPGAGARGPHPPRRAPGGPGRRLSARA